MIDNDNLFHQVFNVPAIFTEIYRQPIQYQRSTGKTSRRPLYPFGVNSISTGALVSHKCNNFDRVPRDLAG